MIEHQTKETHEETKGSTWLKGLLIAARLCLGGIFVYASIDKIFHPAAFADAVFNYQILPDRLINLAAIFLPWLELLLGSCLIAGVWLPGATIIANALLIAFTGALLFNLARGLDIDCGCFSTSSAAGVSDAWYIVRDILFLAIGGIVFYSTFISKNWRPKMQLKKRASNLMEEGL